MSDQHEACRQYRQTCGAERSLLTERIRVVNNKLSWLESQWMKLEGSMDQVLSNEDKVSVLSHLSIVKEKEFVSCENNQKVKFDRLLNKSQQQSADNSIDLSGEQLKKWVVNISKYKLYEPETSVLAKGPNFAIPPSVIPIDEYVLSTEKA